MAKKVSKVVKLQVLAGKATPARQALTSWLSSKSLMKELQNRSV